MADPPSPLSELFAILDIWQCFRSHLDFLLRNFLLHNHVIKHYQVMERSFSLGNSTEGVEAYVRSSPGGSEIDQKPRSEILQANAGSQTNPLFGRTTRQQPSSMVAFYMKRG